MIRYIIKAVLKDFSQYILATLGLIIGITALISMSYLGLVGKIKLYNEIKSQGINIINVYPETVKQTPIRKNVSGMLPSLKDRELEFSRSSLLAVDYSIPVKIAQKQIKYLGRVANSVDVIGTSVEYLYGMNYKVVYGESIDDNSEGCVIGWTLFKDLFDESIDAIGSPINVNGKFIKVIGILGKTGVSSSGQDKDNLIVMPIDYFIERFKNDNYFDAIYIQPHEIESLKDVKNNLIYLLKSLKNNFVLPKPEDFSVRTMDSYLDKQRQIGSMMVVTTFIVSSITMLVGGLGVMAVMLILSIKETREIGIKRAIGATSRAVFVEYIIKSLFIAFVSSFFGVILGLVSCFIIEKSNGVSAPYPWNYTMLGIFLAFAVSIIFGLLPAYKSSRIEPYEALHYQ